MQRRRPAADVVFDILTDCEETLGRLVGAQSAR